MGTVHQVGSVATPKTLRVLPRGTALVPDYEAFAHPAGIRRFHGWRHDPTLGDFVQEQVRTKWQPSGVRQGGFVKQDDQVVEVPDSAEMRRHLRGDERKAEWNGDLWPADPETAALVGVPFDPTFGDEHPVYSKALSADPKMAKYFPKKTEEPVAGTRVPAKDDSKPTDASAAKETAK